MNDNPVEQPIARGDRSMPGYREGVTRLPGASDSGPREVAEFSPSAEASVSPERIERPITPGAVVQNYDARFSQQVVIDVSRSVISRSPVQPGRQPGESAGLLPRAAE